MAICQYDNICFHNPRSQNRCVNRDSSEPSLNSSASRRRQVDMPTFCQTVPMAGDTSPDYSHAHGALNDNNEHRKDHGIIPACAGSTCCPSGGACRAGDHPRMRGEHSVYRRCAELVSGRGVMARDAEPSNAARAKPQRWRTAEPSSGGGAGGGPACGPGAPRRGRGLPCESQPSEHGV